MPKGPKVSIITPCLNGEAYLKATLDSLYAQTYDAFEHLVIDGGSTDSSHQIVAQYPRTKLVVASDNGMYEAINRGFDLATGDVFAYLNADDLYLPDSLQRAVDMLADGADLVYGDLELIDPKGAPIYTRKYFPYGDRWMRSVDYSTIPQPATFWTKALHRRVGPFDARFKLAGDFDFFLRACAPPARVVHLPRSLAKFRIHPDALSQKALDRMRAEVDQILDKHGIKRTLERRLTGLAFQTAMRALNLPGMLWHSARKRQNR